MKKILLILSATVCTLSNAQITITASDIPALGAVAIDINDSIVTTSPGSAGANQTWNLTTLKNTGADTITYVTPGSSPYASTYPTANNTTLIKGTSGGSLSIYEYVYTDASGAYTLGLAFPFFAGPYIGKNTPPYKFITFPATYGMSIIDSCIGTASFAYPVGGADSMKSVSHMHYTETMDGWGNVTTPAGTFPCLRDIAIRHHVDSTFLHTSGVWALYNAPTTKIDTFYFWYSNNQKFLVAEIQVQQSLPKKGFYLQSLTTGVNEHAFNSQINIYPNPAATIFVIETNTKDKQTVQLFDINGRLVLNQNINGTTNIDATNLNGGIYMLTIKTANSVINKKLVIVR